MYIYIYIIYIYNESMQNTRIFFIQFLSLILSTPSIIFIIKYIDLEHIFFTINVDAMSSSIVFSTFDYVFLLIILLT